MEEAGSPTGNFKYDYRVSNPLFTEACSLERLENIKIQDKYFSKNDGTDRAPGKTKNPGISPESRTEFYFYNVFSEKERRGLTTDIRPPKPKQVCKSKRISSNITFANSRLPTGWGLDDQNRHVAGVLSRPCGSVPSLLSPANLQRRAVSDDEPALRPLICSTRLRINHELDRRDPSCKRLENRSLPRRFSSSCAGQGETKVSANHVTEPSRSSRLVHKPEQKCAGTMSGVGFLGHNLEHPKISNQPSVKEGREHIQPGKRDEREFSLYSRSGAVPAGSPELRELRRAQRSTSLPPSAKISEAIRRETGQTEATDRRPGTSGTELVEQVTDIDYPSTQESRDSFFNNRCSRQRLGSPAGQHVHVRLLDEKPAVMAFEQKGDVGSLPGNKTTGTPPARSPHPSPNRQPNGSSLYTEGRRDEICGPLRPGLRSASYGRQFESSSVSLLSSRKIQWNRRQTIQRKCPSRMAPTTSSHRSHFQRMGHPRSGFICKQKFSSRQELCLSRLHRSVGKILRCLQSRLGLQASVDIPSPQPDSQSPGTPEQKSREILASGPQMGTNILDARPSESEPSTSKNDREPGRSISGLVHGEGTATGRPTYSPSVEDWGWGSMTSNWSTQEKALLKESWRSSTIQTYRAPIKRWLTWCQENQVDPLSPGSPNLARFLANLTIKDNLAYATILVHKSAVSTFCSGEAKNSSSSFLVKQVLKAISNSKSKEERAAIWDAQILFNWLAAGAPKLTLFEASRRTAAILLLASGRRVHDLTLLKISKDHLTNLGQEIILWPSFGSKTDRASFRQSGWKLSKHENIRVCPVTWIRALLKLSEKRRKGQNWDELFITVTGPVKPASKTVIAGWVRSALTEAGIDASPGSVRAAVASRGWVDNLPVQEIVDRGNWKCVETFANHYCRRVESNNQGKTSLLYRNFTPV